jgi:transcriptional regulator with XRE-family HTH domain
MYLILKKGVLQKLVKNAIKKAGTIRKLAKRLKIPKSTIYYYDRELRNITESNLTKIEQYLQVKIKGEKILKKIPLNWKQIKGGKKRVSKAKKIGKFDDQLSLAREKSKETLRLWHKR